MEDAFAKKLRTHQPIINLNSVEDDSVGFDDDHKEFIRLSRLVVDAKVSDQYEVLMADVLIHVRDYIEGHFSKEENRMRDVRYPDLKRHAKKHAKFKKQILALIARHDDGDLSVLDEAPGVVLTWFRFHIMLDDLPFQKWLLERPVEWIATC